MKPKESVERIWVDGKLYEKDDELYEVSDERQSVIVLGEEEEMGIERHRSQEMPNLTVEEGEVLDLLKKLDARKVWDPTECLDGYWKNV